MENHQESLHRRLLARDPGVLDDLIAEYGAPVHHLASMIIGRLGSPEDAEEAAGDAFAAAWNRASEFDPARTTLKSWLLMLTKYAALDRRRALQRRGYTREGEVKVIPLTAAPEPVEPTTPEDAVLRSDSQRELHSALARLPAPDRDLLIRRYFFEEPIAELARELGLSRSAMDNRLWRARQMLKHLLQVETEGTPNGRSAV